MKLRGVEYNFGRCVRMTFFYKGSSVLCIEHAPELDRSLTAAIDINVKDMPSAHDKDQPGFMANVTIYNPNKDILNAISSGAVWINDYGKINESSNTIDEKDILNSTQRYFNDRLRVVIEAGYTKDEGTGVKSANYNNLISGYVQGSALYRKGTEWVLTFGVFDIDPMAMSRTITKQYLDENYKVYFNNDNRLVSDTWHNTLVKYIQKFEKDRLATDAEMSKKYANSKAKPNNTDALDTEINGVTLNQIAGNKDRRLTDVLKTGSNLPEGKTIVTKNQYPTIPVTEEDRKKTNWFRVIYVTSYDDYLNTKRGNETPDVAKDVELEAQLMSYKMQYGTAISGDNLPQLLNGLCAKIPELNWKKDDKNVSNIVYVIWKGKPVKDFVIGDKATIKIWNYQNLLDSPSISGAGQMTIKMIYNPDCVCLATIALMLKKEYETTIKDEDGKTKVVDALPTAIVKTNFEANLMESMAAQTSGLSTYGNIQVTGANAVAALNKEVVDAKKRGYLFNTGFPIISVEHILSTYKSDWTTIVKTAPSLYGFNVKKN